MKILFKWLFIDIICCLVINILYDLNIIGLTLRWYLLGNSAGIISILSYIEILGGKG